MENINILMSVNKSFLKHAENMMFSVLYYSTRPINFYLMYREEELKSEDLNHASKLIRSYF